MAFTDWLSMMAALGVASRPSTSRTRASSASAARSQVPPSRHFRKYHQTVPRGSRSWGSIRQGMPPPQCVQYAIDPLTQVRGPVMAPCGARRQQRSQFPHWASVKSLGSGFLLMPPA